MQHKHLHEINSYQLPILTSFSISLLFSFFSFVNMLRLLSYPVSLLPMSIKTFAYISKAFSVHSKAFTYISKTHSLPTNSFTYISKACSVHSKAFTYISKCCTDIGKLTFRLIFHSLGLPKDDLFVLVESACNWNMLR